MVTSEDPYLTASIKIFLKIDLNKQTLNFSRIHKRISNQIIKESPNIPTEATFAIKNIESQSFLINLSLQT
jgi:ATP-dependent Lon protease